MAALSAIGFGVFLTASLGVGIRLILLARRTRQLPELCVGVAMLCFGPFGYGLVLAARLLPDLPRGAAVSLSLAGLTGVSLGAAALLLFAWRVFRPHEAWARAASLAGFALLSISSLADALGRALVSLEGVGVWLWLAFATRTLPLVWIVLESLRYYQTMRRRSALGLADPVVGEGFLLWGLGAVCATLSAVCAIVTRAVTGLSVMRMPEMVLPISLLSLTAVVTIWLAFFPPAAYLRALRRRDGALACPPKEAPR